MPQKLLKVGIQGGEGSFNHQAFKAWQKKHPGTEIELFFLHRSAPVLKSLIDGSIDRGFFAIFNNYTRVLVRETKEAAGAYHFTMTENLRSECGDIGIPLSFLGQSSETFPTIQIDELISIPIQHFLMHLPEILPEDIFQVTAHTQVLQQCKKNLEKYLSKVKMFTGEGRQYGTAGAAEALRNGQLDPKTYILGSKDLAEVYGLKLVDHSELPNGWQDTLDNRTYFAVARKTI